MYELSQRVEISYEGGSNIKIIKLGNNSAGHQGEFCMFVCSQLVVIIPGGQGQFYMFTFTQHVCYCWWTGTPRSQTKQTSVMV